ncbi:MAG: hypothetical protein H6Q90_373 [Deltaproteobacteria bacterium]|nr:hypothetical protein [Deltaproteobacteria bacterium]
MKRASSLSLGLLAVTVFACGPKPKPVQLAPLPADQPVAEAPADPKKDPEPAKPPEPQGPVEVKIPAAKVTVKLVSPGKGKRTALHYTGKLGVKQQVELAMDFASTTSQGGQTQDQSVPTIVLLGDSETKSVDKDGKSDYAFTVTSTDARDVKGATGAPPAEKFKVALEALMGLSIGGSVTANGTLGEMTLRIEKPTELSVGALELIRLTMPTWPILPTEPVGVGAKWQSTTVHKLADRLDVTQVTSYEVVAQKGNTWTIKGTTKVSGSDQDVDGGRISGISGSGTSTVALADGALYPTYKGSVETKFSATEPKKDPKDPATEKVEFKITVGGAVTPK